TLALFLLHRRILVAVDQTALTLRRAGGEHLRHDRLDRIGIGFNRAGQRIAAQGAETHQLLFRLLARLQPHAVVIDHDERTVASHDRTLRREIERHDRKALHHRVLPDIEFGPVGERKDADALALVDARVVIAPKLRPLALGIPGVVGIAEGEDALLGAALLLVAAGAAE